MRYSLLSFLACPACASDLICIVREENAETTPEGLFPGGDRVSAGTGIGPAPAWSKESAAGRLLRRYATAAAPESRGLQFGVETGLLACGAVRPLVSDRGGYSRTAPRSSSRRRPRGGVVRECGARAASRSARRAVLVPPVRRFVVRSRCAPQARRDHAQGQGGRAWLLRAGLQFSVQSLEHLVHVLPDHPARECFPAARSRSRRRAHRQRLRLRVDDRVVLQEWGRGDWVRHLPHIPRHRRAADGAGASAPGCRRRREPADPERHRRRGPGLRVVPSPSEPAWRRCAATIGH